MVPATAPHKRTPLARTRGCSGNLLCPPPHRSSSESAPRPAQHPRGTLLPELALPPCRLHRSQRGSLHSPQGAARGRGRLVLMSTTSHPSSVKPAACRWPHSREATGTPSRPVRKQGDVLSTEAQARPSRPLCCWQGLPRQGWPWHSLVRGGSLRPLAPPQEHTMPRARQGRAMGHVGPSGTDAGSGAGWVRAAPGHGAFAQGPTGRREQGPTPTDPSQAPAAGRHTSPPLEDLHLPSLTCAVRLAGPASTWPWVAPARPTGAGSTRVTGPGPHTCEHRRNITKPPPCQQLFMCSRGPVRFSK